MAWIEAVKAAVPSGKALAWIGGSIVMAFLAGIGWATGTSDVAAAVEQVPQLQQAVHANTERIDVIEGELQEAEQDRGRILCLVTLTAQGEELSPLEVNSRCP